MRSPRKIETFEAGSAGEVFEVLQAAHLSGRIFRGHEPSTRHLQTSLGRLFSSFARVDPGLADPVECLRREVLGQNDFRDLTGVIEGTNDYEEPNWLEPQFKMQHFGAPTRLLDWS